MRLRALFLGLTLALAGGGSAHAAPGARPQVAKNVVERAKPAAKRTRTAKAATKPAQAKRLANAALTPRSAIARTKKFAQSYAKEHKLAVRTLKVGPAGSQIERVFVPILPTTFGSFYQKFAASSGNETVILRYTEANKHMIMSLEPTDIYLWGHNKNVGGNGNQFYRDAYHNTNGESAQWKGASFVFHPSSMSALKSWLAKTAKGPQCQGHCMMWLPNVPTGKGDMTLAKDLGITRSADGANLRNKIMHAGNHRVGVVGIHVNSLKEFKDMSEADMLGALPTNGLEQARLK